LNLAKDFLTATNPEVAIYMSAKDNKYGHPHEETINALNEIDAQIYGTDICGNIIVTTNGNEFTIATQK